MQVWHECSLRASSRTLIISWKGYRDALPSGGRIFDHKIRMKTIRNPLPTNEIGKDDRAKCGGGETMSCYNGHSLLPLAIMVENLSRREYLEYLEIDKE